MKKLNHYLAFCVVFALLMAGCSEDESGLPMTDSKETVALQFGALLNDMSRQQNLNKNHQDVIPGCSEGDPTHVRVALTNSDDEWVGDKDGDAGEFIEIDVLPDGNGGWMTEESAILELTAGDYDLHYFLVYSGETLLWVAPREDDTYEGGNFAAFVSDPLPIPINLRTGVKKYVNIEVLCYDENMADDYGYLFFNFMDVDTMTFCAFGNYCDENGRHYPAAYSMRISNADSGVYYTYDSNTDSEWVTNETGMYTDPTEAYALQLCAALPVTDDGYRVEIMLNDFTGAYGDVNNTIIRDFVITADQVMNLSAEDEYYHFREGTNCGDDTPPFGEPTCDGPDSDLDTVPDECDICNGDDPDKDYDDKVDYDKDGVPDDCDACPTRAGIPSDNPLLNGCQQDEQCPGSDGDGDGRFGDCDCDNNTNFDPDNNCDDEPGVGECGQTAYMQGDIRFSQVEGANSNNWGWIENFNIDNEITTIVNDIYAGASTQYNMNDQTKIGTVTAIFNDTTNELTLTFDFDSSVQELEEVHVDISEVNRTQFNPGGYRPGKSFDVGDGDVLTYSYENVDDSFKLIVHGQGACKDAAE